MRERQADGRTNKWTDGDGQTDRDRRKETGRGRSREHLIDL